MRHDRYAELFQAAEAETLRRNLSYRRLPGTAGDSGLAMQALPVLGRVVDRFGPLDPEVVRVQCAANHLQVFDALPASPACVLTVGDIELDGELHYGTTYERLDDELRGRHRHDSADIPCHVWLTFPDMHVVDVSIFLYKHVDRVTAPFRWSEYLICSDPRHGLATELDLTYKPMLLGRSVVLPLVV